MVSEQRIDGLEERVALLERTVERLAPASGVDAIAAGPAAHPSPRRRPTPSRLGDRPACLRGSPAPRAPFRRRGRP